MCAAWKDFIMAGEVGIDLFTPRMPYIHMLFGSGDDFTDTY